MLETIRTSAVSELAASEAAEYLDALDEMSIHRSPLLLHRAGTFWKRGEVDVAETLIVQSMELIRSVAARGDSGEATRFTRPGM